MSFLQTKSELVSCEVILTGLDIINPGEGCLYIQNGDNCGTIIFSTEFVPSRNCIFSIQTGKGGLYLLNNSKVIYSGDKYLLPNKIHNFNLVYKDNGWKLYNDSGYIGDNNVIIDWTTFFNRNVTGAPPLAARKYALFINGIYNALLTYNTLFDQGIVNESARILSNTYLPGVITDTIYDKYPKLDAISVAALQNFLSSYVLIHVIPSSATDPTYTIPPPSEQTKWYGVNPALPNWNSTNIEYLVNTYTDVLHSPDTTMEADSKALISFERTRATNEVAYHFANTPPPAHMINIACSMLANKDMSSVQLCKVLSVVSIGIADAGIFAWTIKFTYWGARPVQYISGYNPVIPTPNFPGFISGHSTFSAVWDQLLGMMIPSVRNISKYIADLSGISRIYGGIHFSDDNESGLDSGRKIGLSIYNQLISKINANQPFLN